jgi:3D-(3,5/4)-trihydroxycyclohexane-1,2-dione acylhydrolase (decyclizing)
MKGYVAKTPEEFRLAVQDALKQERSCLIDAKVLPKTMCEGYDSWWHFGLASTSKSTAVTNARKKIDEKLKSARMY